MKIVFAGGGTGGHIYPALAVADEIRYLKPETEVLFLSGRRGIERKIVADSGYTVSTLPVTGLPRKLSPAMVGFAWRLGVSIILSRRELRKFRPSVVMATGGYVSGPPLIAAWSLGVPTVIQEQNSFPGITNRKLGRFADMIFLGFSDAVKYFSSDNETLVTGNPIRNAVYSGNREEAARFYSFDPLLKTVLIFGGSQGSAAINGAVAGSVEILAQKGYQVLWQTGEREFESRKNYNGCCDGRIRVVAYINEMKHAYAAADIVVARAGAMSIAEITACGLPAVFIPLPTAAENHQEYNAQSLVDAGAASMILERELKSSGLEMVITDIIDSDDRLAMMSEASKALGKRDAARNIAGIILDRYGCN
ncbi:undecaprenyldiphospho-muramoylpentapeptide beta-N-acetylglucosaminyltransferase [Candidatus Latescibacterota bacterium]